MRKHGKRESGRRLKERELALEARVARLRTQVTRLQRENDESSNKLANYMFLMYCKSFNTRKLLIEEFVKAIAKYQNTQEEEASYGQEPCIGRGGV